MTDYGEDPEIEYSELSGPCTQDSVTVEMNIYRIKGSSEGWALEVVDAENNSTTWDDLFATDAAALEEFNKALAEVGIQEFVQFTPTNVH
ncbi:hypothetical protein U0C82_16710 [Fulvimarina sp. 2208YS6-2-32]|uniref:Uncharacterized protein n=1 Tax=Fulvimarina uroteuthidis TaxID=3098149 RepID=A0ABU5I7E1_9HYPH|nr:hypothetical protein [Fulvimarina sp. 2208YS6-2-32]MDY8110784.1 hypothetical protein [Fulvimarina sp. 2208YS6-2-32]